MSRRLTISFVIHNVYGVGGTNRAVINLAGALARRNHDVEIVSVFRRLDQPMMAIHSRVALRPLVDMRADRPDRLDPDQWQRSSIVPAHEEFYNAYSQLTDARLARYFASSRRDVYIGTRPAINLAVARWAPNTAIKIAQEHQTHVTLPPTVRTAMQQAYAGLAAAVTVTQADAAAFVSHTPAPGLRIEAIPNSVPAPTLHSSQLVNPIIAAVGRLDSVKRYDLLIRAFAHVRSTQPDWQLRIYGGGAEAAQLRALIASLDLHDSVLLMGRTAHVEEEWAKASIAVSTSERESFGMSIVEAMRAGLPVVSTRAPVGPEEIITDGHDGFLVPVGDVDAIAQRMTELAVDSAMRWHIGRAALASSTRYDPDVVAQRYEDLLLDLAQHSRARAPKSVRSRVVALRRTVTPVLRGNPVGRAAKNLRGGDSMRVVARCAADGRVVLDVHDPSIRKRATIVQLVARKSKQVVILRPHTDPKTSEQTCDIPAAALAEDRWNVFLRFDDRRPQRVVYAGADTRPAVNTDLGASGPFSRVLPYETQDGFLALRAWHRRSHAECSHVQQRDDAIVIRGRAVWARAGIDLSTAYAERRSADRRRISGAILAAEHSGSFTVAFPVDELARVRLTRHDDWDLYLSAGSEVARIARLGDDVVERKSVFEYPAVSAELDTDALQVEDLPSPVVTVKPYLTITGDLAMFVHERES